MSVLPCPSRCADAERQPRDASTADIAATQLPDSTRPQQISYRPNRTDALIFAGGDADTSARVVVRPSGTEPKVKFYIEVRSGVAGDLAGPAAARPRL